MPYLCFLSFSIGLGMVCILNKLLIKTLINEKLVGTVLDSAGTWKKALVKIVGPCWLYDDKIF